MEALFAITGIAPTSRDLALWRDRKRFPLVQPNTVGIEPADIPAILADGKWKEEGPTPTTYLDAEGNEVCSVTGLKLDDPKWTVPTNLFKRLDDGFLADGGTIRLASPQTCKKVALSGLFYYEYHGDKVWYGVSEFRRTDYVVEVSLDGMMWAAAGAKQGICGEDGAHVHTLPNSPIQFVRVKLSGRHYALDRAPRETVGEGLTWIQRGSGACNFAFGMHDCSVSGVA
jgi:hypothetical protein